MEKRVFFKGWLLPLLLIAPQILVSAVFFFYPAGQAVWQSLFIPDPFGLSMQYVGLGNFKYLLSDPYYRASFFTTGLFSILVTLVSMIPALFLAIVADRLIKGAGTYRTMLIWPTLSLRLSQAFFGYSCLILALVLYLGTSGTWGMIGTMF